MAYKIGVVDDDLSIGEILSFNLKNSGYEVLYAPSAEEAWEWVHQVDLVLLDIMMKGMSGYQLAEKMRQQNVDTPIIFITAKNTENDMLTGFSVGGDDYVSKPFSIQEVLARVRAVLKRRGNPSDRSVSTFVFKGLRLNTDTKEVWIDEMPVALTKTETELLFFLFAHQDRPLSRQEIIRFVWQETPYITERTVDVHITRLRKKLADYACLVTNRSGYGYRFSQSSIPCE